MSTKIIVDSTTDLTGEMRAQVAVVPLTVHFGTEAYLDGVDIDHRAFYEKLVESDVLPSTSQPSPAAFESVFRRLRQDGDEAVVIVLSEKLSGTCQSALIAAADYEGIHVVDSGSVAIGGTILTKLALRLAAQGLGAGEIAARLEQEKQRIVLVALVDTLEYLQRGGRLSRTAAIAGTALRLKPVLAVTHGEIGVLGRARGSRQGNNLLVEQIEKAGGVDFSLPVMLGYTGLSDALLRKYIDDSRRLWERGMEQPPYVSIGSVIGTHAGPGAVAVAFFKGEAQPLL